MDSSSPQTQKPPVQRSIRSFFQPQLSPSTPSLPNSTSGGRLNSVSTPSSASTTSPALAIPPPAGPPTLLNINPPPAAAVAPPSSSLPPQAAISRVDACHIQQFRRVNSLLLPISYPDSIYNSIVDPRLEHNLSRVVLWKDTSSPRAEAKVVGGIICRIDTDPETQSRSVYILSLGVLSPYRALGLATALFESVVQGIIQSPSLAQPGLSLYAHVWTENADGLHWYFGRGFAKQDPPIVGYYRKLRPDTAWVVYRPLTASDYLKYSNKDAIPTSPNMSITEAPPKASAPPPPKVGSSISPPPLPAQSLANGGSSASSSNPTPPPPPGRGVTSSAAVPPPPRPAPLSQQRGTSYQTARPANEWNDLPEDILKASSRNSSAAGLSELEPQSSASSRSSSRAAPGRKKRAYPAAAFGV